MKEQTHTRMEDDDSRAGEEVESCTGEEEESRTGEEEEGRAREEEASRTGGEEPPPPPPPTPLSGFMGPRQQPTDPPEHFPRRLVNPLDGKVRWERCGPAEELKDATDKTWFHL